MEIPYTKRKSYFSNLYDYFYKLYFSLNYGDIL